GGRPRGARLAVDRPGQRGQIDPAVRPINGDVDLPATGITTFWILYFAHVRKINGSARKGLDLDRVVVERPTLNGGQPGQADVAAWAAGADDALDVRGRAFVGVGRCSRKVERPAVEGEEVAAGYERAGLGGEDGGRSRGGEGAARRKGELSADV